MSQEKPSGQWHSLGSYGGAGVAGATVRDLDSRFSVEDSGILGTFLRKQGFVPPATCQQQNVAEPSRELLHERHSDKNSKQYIVISFAGYRSEVSPHRIHHQLARLLIHQQEAI